MALHCPWCGEHDKSEHLNINLEHGFYGCWINPSHRGKNLVRLVKKLLTISYSEAQEIVGLNKTYINDGELEALLVKLFGEVPVIPEEKATYLELDKNFLHINNEDSARQFYQYLYNRGFLGKTDKVIEKYNLLYSLYGDFAYRIIFPITMNNQLMTWIGRTVSSVESLRYKNLSTERSVKKANKCLFNYDTIKQGGNILFINEGVFDAVKMDFFLPEENHATCVFTKNMTDEQMFLIAEVADKYKEVRVMFDKDAKIEVIKYVEELSFLRNIKPHFLTEAKDPAELSYRQIQKLI